MERHEVFRSDRIRVTERLITSCKAVRVLEIGAGDYSFDYLRLSGGGGGQKSILLPRVMWSAN